MSSSEHRRRETSEGIMANKYDFIEDFVLIGRYDDWPVERIVQHLQFYLSELDEPEAPNAEKARKRLLADGKISRSQSDVISTITQKIAGMTRAMTTILLQMQLQMQLIPDEANWTEVLKGRAIFVLEKFDRQLVTLTWIEYWAEEEPDNAEALYNDALEFPDPPFQ
ncbi:hypothetical protein CHU98_g6987 [Xylaria longipes]|nr:hypothetical protein CHU98_g6987 [Xylaria longipes]